MALPGAPPLNHAAAFGVAATMVLLIELTGRPGSLQPQMVLPVVVVIGTFLAGLSGGALAAAIGATYTLLYYSQPASGGFAAGATQTVAATEQAENRKGRDHQNKLLHRHSLFLAPRTIAI